MYSWGWARSSKYIYRVKKIFIFLIFPLVKHHQIQPNIILTMFHYKPTPRSLNFIKKLTTWRLPRLTHDFIVIRLKRYRLNWLFIHGFINVEILWNQSGGDSSPLIYSHEWHSSHHRRIRRFDKWLYYRFTTICWSY